MKFKISFSRIEKVTILKEIDGDRKYFCSPELSQLLINRIDEIIDENDFALEIPFSAKRWYGKSYTEYVGELSQNEYNKRIIVSESEYKKWITPFAVPIETQEVKWNNVRSDIEEILRKGQGNDTYEVSTKITTYLKLLHALRKIQG
jgi:hypothetical protein